MEKTHRLGSRKESVSTVAQPAIASPFQLGLRPGCPPFACHVTQVRAMEQPADQKQETRDPASKRKREAESKDEAETKTQVYPKRLKGENTALDAKNERKASTTSTKKVYERSLVSLSATSEAQLKEFESIASDSSVMNSIHTGPWNRRKIDDLVKSTREDDRTNQHNRDYFHWLVLAKGEDEPEAHVVGYVGFHPFKNKPNSLQIRVFVKPSGQGHGTNAVDLSIKEYYTKLKLRKPIWSVIEPSNTPSVKLFRSLSDWEDKETIPVYRKDHRVFLVKPPVN